MCKCYPCPSCWCNLGTCSGFGFLICCCGVWMCKDYLMEQIDPNCCYCFQEVGLGCNLFCFGCSCCYATWFKLYVTASIRVQPNVTRPYADVFPHPSPYVRPSAPYSPAPYPLQPNPYNSPH